MLPSFRGPATPAQTALNITGLAYLSWTQVDQMRRCPKKYGFQYVQREKPAFLPSSLLFGSAIHAAIEHHLQRRLEGTSSDRSMLLTRFDEEWRRRDGEQPGVPIKFNKGEDENTLFEQAGRMIDAFLASMLAQPRGRILAVEEKLRGRVLSTLPDVVARVDAIWQDDDFLHVVDYKTSRSRWSEDKVNESADQLLLYHHMAGSMSRHLDLPIKLNFGVITKAMSPAVQLLDVPVSPGRVRQVISLIEQVWGAIQAGNFYPSPSPMNCSTCPFKARCPAFANP